MRSRPARLPQMPRLCFARRPQAPRRGATTPPRSSKVRRFDLFSMQSPPANLDQQAANRFGSLYYPSHLSRRSCRVGKLFLHWQWASCALATATCVRDEAKAQSIAGLLLWWFVPVADGAPDLDSAKCPSLDLYRDSPHFFWRKPQKKRRLGNKLRLHARSAAGSEGACGGFEGSQRDA
jgi:hypothetical protein